MEKFTAELKRIDEACPQEGQVIIVDQIVHLGRSDTVKDYEARDTPQNWHDAALAIRIADAHEVSRNHAVLYPPKEPCDVWSIMDLNSLNGTYVNGYNAPAGRSMPLPQQGAVIDLGKGAAKFEFRPLQRDGNINYALMVGNSGGNLRGTTKDVEDLSKALSGRGFCNNIETLMNAAATREAIISGLTRMQRLVANDAIFIFYFSGHGNRDGSLTLRRV